MKGFIAILPLLLSSSLLVAGKPSPYSEDYEDQYWRTWSIGQAPVRGDAVSFNAQQNYQPWAGYQEPVYQPEQSWQSWNEPQKPSQELPTPSRNQKPSENTREPQPWQEPAKPIEKPFVQDQQYYYNQNTDRKPVKPYVPENPWINHESAVPNVPQQKPEPSWQQNTGPQSNNVQNRPAPKPQPNNPSWDSHQNTNNPAPKPVVKPPQEQSIPRPQQQTPQKPNRPQPPPPQVKQPSPVPVPPQYTPNSLPSTNNIRAPEQPNREIRNKPAPSYPAPQQQQYRPPPPPPPPPAPAQNHYEDSEEQYEIVTGRPDSRCPRVDNPRKPVDLPVFENCRKFLKCYGGMAYEMDCPADLQFSVEKSRCDYPAVANCRA